MDKERLYISTIAADAYFVAQKYGVGIEIADFCTAWNIDEKFAETDSKLRRGLDGVKRRLLHAPFNELFPCAIDKKARELAAFRYNQAIDLAKQYNASKVIIHGGYNPRMYYPEWYVEQSVMFWKDFIKSISGDVHIALENTFEETPEMLLDIVRGVGDSRLGICLDVGHINAYSDIPVMEWVKKFEGFISHYHIHNNDGAVDTHNALDRGNIPMEELFALTKKISPAASYTIETMNAESSVRWIVDTIYENK